VSGDSQRKPVGDGGSPQGLYGPAVRRPAPAFQEYAADMLANEQVKEMSLGEAGLLFLMRLSSWVNGRVPKDPARLGKLLSQPADEVKQRLTEKVLAFFDPLPGQPEYLHAPELTNYKKQLADRHQERSRSGRRGAESKWKKSNRSGNGSADGSANGSLSKAQLSKGERGSPDEEDIPF